MKKQWIAWIILIVLLATLAGCGSKGGSSATKSDQDSQLFVSDDEDIIQEKVGAIGSDSNGSITWYQYGYDQEGNLAFERIPNVLDNGYSETTYDKQGNMTGWASYDGNGNLVSGVAYTYDDKNNQIACNYLPEGNGMSNVEYTYEFDASGKPLIRYEKNVEDGSLLNTTEYVYSGGEKPASSKVSYPSGSYMESTYDEAGNLLSQIYYEGGAQTSSYQYKYDEKGNKIWQSISSLMEGEYEQTMENTYNDQGQLIKVVTKNSDGTIIYTMEYVYAEPSDKLYTLEELQNRLNGTDTAVADGGGQSTDNKKENGDGDKQEFTGSLAKVDVKVIEEEIRKDYTMFTFGYRSSRFMELEKVSLVETGTDSDGDYAEIMLTYTSQYGKFTDFGNVYGTLNADGSFNITKCKKTGWDTSNPEDKLTKEMESYLEPYVYFGLYKVLVMDGNSYSYDSSNAYSFAGKEGAYPGGFSYHGTNSLSNESFTYTTGEPTVPGVYDFTLKICDSNGLCETYLCKTLDEKFAFEATAYNTRTGQAGASEIRILESAQKSTINKIMSNR